MDTLIDEAGILSGYTALKDEQNMAIQGFLDGRDVFIVLPTDFGKTACFTCLPHAFDLYHGRSLENKSIVIVVSPPNSTVPTSKTTGRHCDHVNIT